MTINRFVQAGLLAAGLIAVVSFPFHGDVRADSAVPIPLDKPQLVLASLGETDIPTPTHKPTAIAELPSTTNTIPPIVKTSSATSKVIFSDKQARLYRDIFSLQEQGEMKAANEKISRLGNALLMGHVLAQRYLHPAAYKASYHELKDWMVHYADHPQAASIYKLAVSRRPPLTHDSLTRPHQAQKLSGNLDAVSRSGKNYKSRKARSVADNKKLEKSVRDIRRHLARREATTALNILSTDYAVKFLDDVEYDRLRADIAASYLFADKTDQADRLSSASLKRSGQFVPMAGWVQGLIRWQQGDYAASARAFETAASSSYASGWMVSAAGYWASRSHMRGGNGALVSQWLELAATYPRTFYGLIATRALGHDIDFDWSVPSLTRDHIRLIESTQNGRRAAALIQVGRTDLAEAELRRVDIGGVIKTQEALLAYANYYHLPALSMQLGNAFMNPNGGLYDAALYPLPSWRPQGGYRVGEALIHAIVRQESRFRPSAQNTGSGAVGLMQLMPATANYISGHGIYGNEGGQHQLKNPAVNLEIGQTYIERLLNDKSVKKDLLSLAVAYNAGPGNLARWKQQKASVNDPLLFIETIPFNETRAFVERVLANYWIYRMRLGQDTPSLDDVAEGKWARYADADDFDEVDDTLLASR